MPQKSPGFTRRNNRLRHCGAVPGKPVGKRVTEASLDARLAEFVGRRYGPYRAWDAVNAPMIRHWREAIRVPGQDDGGNPEVAPRTMLNVWLMRGVANRRPADSVAEDPYQLVQLLRDAGHIGVVATQCRQDYVRDLRVGDRVESMVTVESVGPQKSTGLGVGHFVVLRHDYLVDGEPVGSMRFTTLHYTPKPRPVAASAEPSAPRPAPPQPGISDDTRFFWDGLKQKKLLVQRCDSCGLLRHPPGPACPACHGLGWTPTEIAGRGTLYSWVVVHHAVHPGFDSPHVVGLVALEHNVRLVAPLTGIDRAALREGMALEIVFPEVAGENRLPSFRPLP